MKVLGVKFAPFQIPISRRIETFAVLFFATVFMFFGVLGVFLCVYLFLSTTYLSYIPVIYLTWFFTDRDICNRGGRTLYWLRNSRIWEYFRDYFPIKLIKTAELDPNQNYIFGYHPHGIMCAGAFCNFSTEGNHVSKVFPGIVTRVMTLEGQFLFPFHRDFFLGVGACAATKESINYLLNEQGTGNAVVIVIGGAAEALDAHPKMCTLTLRRRKGFVRLAIKNGAWLVPVYSFGENDLYDQVENPTGTWLRWFQNKMTKIMGFSPPLFKGRGVFQYAVGVLPYRKPINTVVGAPIKVRKNEHATEEEVNEVHEEYMERLQQLFETHKAKYGYAEQVLEFT